MHKLLGLVLIAQYVWLGFGFFNGWDHWPNGGEYDSIYTKGNIPYFCRLPAVSGPCYALIPRWAYNPWSGSCEQFIYGGCFGNSNNFETQAECEGCCPTNTDPGSCPTVNITLCQQPVDTVNGQCGGGQFDVFTTCGSYCPYICRQPDPELCIEVCVKNICQCTFGSYRRVSDCQCVTQSECLSP